MDNGFTATVNIDNKTNWSGIKKHVEHDKNIAHSNKDIYFYDTQFNRSGSISKLNKILDLHYKKYIKVHDKKMIEQGRPSRVWKNVDGLFANKKSNYDERLVATFANKEDFDELENKILKSYYEITGKSVTKDNLFEINFHKKFLSATSIGLEKYAKGFNKRNSKLTMVEYETNVDEKGAPHIHARVIPRGHTKSGTPSPSLDNALKEQLSIKDNRLALSKWREQEDEAVIRNMKSAYKECFPNIDLPEFKLFRTHNATKVDMETYKKIKSNLDKSVSENDARSSKLDFREKKISDVEQELRLRIADYKNDKSLNDEASKEILERTKNLNEQQRILANKKAILHKEQRQFHDDKEEFYDGLEEGFDVIYPEHKAQLYNLRGKNIRINEGLAKSEIVKKIQDDGKEGSLTGIPLLIYEIKRITGNRIKELEKILKKPFAIGKTKSSYYSSGNKEQSRNNEDDLEL